MVGHALIMAIIVAIAADPTPQVRFAIRRSMWSIPAVVGAALVVFASGYWGLHLALYGPGGSPGPTSAEMATHTYSAEHPHGPQAIGQPGTSLNASVGQHHGPVAPAVSVPAASAREAYEASIARMHGPMQEGIQHSDPDVAFVLGMIPHHQAAIDMAQIQLHFGKDPVNRKLAEEIITTQRHEIHEMKAWLAARERKSSK